MTVSPAERLGTAVVYVGLTIIAVVVAVPIAWIVLGSFQPGVSLFSSQLIPESLTIRHYVSLFTETPFPLWFWNTLRLSILNMVFGVTITTMTAFAFSRYRFRGRKAALAGLLIVQMFPAVLAMTAIFIVLSNLGLLNSYVGLLLVYIAAQTPYFAWIVKGYFDNITRSLDEAARIDGASEITILTRVLFPIGKPVVVFIAFQSFMFPWLDFIFPSLILRDPQQWTIALGIFDWVQGFANERYTQFAAASILIAVPITVLFLYLQKHIVAGLSQGAAKG